MAGFDPSGPYEVVFEDVEYARPDGAPLLARVYRPVRAADRLPALIDVHGGAWHYFDRTVDENFVRPLAACGMVVVSLDFRQAPDHRYPSAVADVVAGVRWTRANAGMLGIRPDRVGLIGGSSGGHLAMLAALCPDEEAFLTTPVEGAEGIDARVDFCLPLWGIFDPAARYDYLLERLEEPPGTAKDPFFKPKRLKASQELFFGDRDTMALASVTRRLEAGEIRHLPPVWTVHPELDENVTLAMTERFVAAYRRAGGEIEFSVFPDVGHSFANFPGLAADFCIAGMRDFIKRRLEALDARPPEPEDPRLRALYLENRAQRAGELAEAAQRRITPAKLAHFVLRTSRFEALVQWYMTVLNARVMYKNSLVAFLTYDQEHHRVAIVARDELQPNSQWNAGLEHVGFTFRSMGELLANYVRLRDLGIKPFWCVNHGTTTSLYYVDPDDNQIELQIDNFDTLEDLKAWYRTGDFGKNPIGVNFDPEVLLARYLAGVPISELVKQGSCD